MIGELRNLEILSLLHSNVKQLPEETGLLTHLRILDLRNCTELKVIPPNVLSCLIQLEELYVGNSFTQWDVEGLNNERASLAELTHLSRLTTLEVHIPDANMLPKDLLFEKLQRYKIFVGDVWDWSDKHENSRALKLKLNTSFHLERGIKMLLNGIENLCLDELKGVKSVTDELDMTGFQQLKHLHVQNNVEIEYIINSRGMIISDVVFPVLETLSLKNIINLEEICHGQIPSASFRNLSIMKVEHCEKLKFIFSSTIAKCLPQLQELAIQECSIMGAIIIKEEGEIEDTDMILFPQLRHLELCQLPKLVSFLNTQKSVINDAGEIIPEWELDFHMPILQEQLVFPNLEKLELSSIHSEEILRHNQHRASSSFKLTDPRFLNLRKLIVKGSGNLKYLLSSSTATSMIQLKYLVIEDCKVMEEVLLTEDFGEEEIIPKELFPQLKTLFLIDLPVLKRFCVGRNIIFRSLKGMVIEKCPKFESFIFNPVSSEEISHTAMQPLFNEEVAFPSLEILRLHQRVLEDIAMIGELRNLEILSLLHSNVKQLPEETGLLTHLRILDLRNCTELKVIPPNVLSCLIQLEKLYVRNSFTQWDVEGLNNERASLAELKHLSRLTTLEVHIPDANMLPKDLLFEKLQRYKIFVGDVWDWSDKHENSRALKLKLNTSFHLERGIKMLLNGIENLCLDELKGVKSVIDELDMTGFQQLKHLHVQNNVEIEYIINSRGMIISDVVFPVLEMLSLKNMINLEEICHGQIPSASFLNLSIMKVEHCEKLKFIFSSTIAKGLPQLQELAIQECSIMGAIIIKEEGEIEDTDMILFPQLRHLELCQLPKLVSFLNTQKSVINDAGEIIPEWELDFHMPILQEQVVFPKLETLELSYIHSEEIPLNQHRASSSFKLANIQTDSRFQNLCKLTVKGSGNLKYLLSSSTATFMVQLKILYIEDCKVMEEILLLTEDFGEEEIIPKVFFPQLEDLFLKDLPVLKRFCIGSNIRFPSLTGMTIEKCPKLESFIFKPVSSEEISHTTMQPLFNEKVAFPSLETLTIMHMENLKIIWHDQLAEHSFFKLQSLFVEYCENLVNIFESNMLTRFQSLERLEVSYCSSLQEVFELQRHDVRESHVVTAIPLKRLILRRLLKMKQVWNKDPEGIFSFQNLQEICVLECESLQSLCPASLASSIYFQNLANLEIWKCHGLINLVTSSTAKSLLQLKKMSVSECERITEVVTGEGGEASEVITFTQLTHLKLDCLPNLSSFCSRSYSFEFPSLEEVIVRECPEMKTFSHGALGTPKLERVQAAQEEEFYWKANLNTTIHWLWESKYNTITQ
ncbi:uncharacterized protein LOC142627287 [Castanea sativa]|uniref:uncharacterized protein LOC142627287 n=1 Tax=Castanea sativa TaxID=21020 RepID=UPI003F649649